MELNNSIWSEPMAWIVQGSTGWTDGLDESKGALGWISGLDSPREGLDSPREHLDESVAWIV
jgi:hypothetical protein